MRRMYFIVDGVLGRAWDYFLWLHVDQFQLQRGELANGAQPGRSWICEGDGDRILPTSQGNADGIPLDDSVGILVLPGRFY